ncbi:MAG: serine/threonine protein kinase [Gammaproteobacteria bacterium]
MPQPDDTFPFHRLAPDDILDAVESTGFRCDGHVSALNSYENRVYQIGLEDGSFVVAKFYRPGRWSDETILEEHAFTLELAATEIPVIAPLRDSRGETLLHAGPYRFAVYPRCGGRAPELDDPEHLMQIGRCLARIHNIGAIQPFLHRSEISLEIFAIKPRRLLLDGGFIPDDLIDAYTSLTDLVIDSIDACMQRAADYQRLRLHGDCHLGNVLWYDDAPFMVDFDDGRMGPAIQDLWMFLSGDRNYMTARLHDLLEGYCGFRDFDPRELHLVEPLRTLRMMHYAAWLARRWNDPAFPRAFPWFNSQQYWEDHILTLKEQMAIMQEPPLHWHPL